MIEIKNPVTQGQINRQEALAYSTNKEILKSTKTGLKMVVGQLSKFVPLGIVDRREIEAAEMRLNEQINKAIEHYQKNFNSKFQNQKTTEG